MLLKISCLVLRTYKNAFTFQTTVTSRLSCAILATDQFSNSGALTGTVGKRKEINKTVL